MSEQERVRDVWLTVKEVAAYLQVTEETIRRWVREGELPALALGDKAGLRIREADLDAFIAARYGRTEKAAA